MPLLPASFDPPTSNTDPGFLPYRQTPLRGRSLRRFMALFRGTSRGRDLAGYREVLFVDGVSPGQEAQQASLVLVERTSWRLWRPWTLLPVQTTHQTQDEDDQMQDVRQ